MAITFSGLASGLDTDSIVKDLMALERAPINRIEAKKTNEADRLKAYKQFNEKLVTLKSTIDDMALSSQVKSTSVSLSSAAPFTASSASSEIGSYDISVAQLAQVQKNISDSYASASDAIFGTGSITINGKELTIDSSNNSLANLAADINEVSDETGVSVTILNDGSSGSPYHMIFTGKDASSPFTITSDLVDDALAPIAFNTTEPQIAQQAVVFIDGIKVISDSNTISEAISGLTLNLNEVSTQSDSGTPESGVDSWDWADPPVYNSDTVKIQADTDSLKEKVTNFVSAYNSTMEWIISGYDEFGPSTETASTSSSEDSSTEESLGSTLRGDATINKIKRNLQSVLTNVVKTNGGFSILSEIGIKTQLDGTLKQDNTTLDNALKDNFDDVVLLLSGDNNTPGVMKNFKSLMLEVTSSAGGMYSTQKDAYDAKTNRFDDQINYMELRMEKREAALRARFSSMEQLVSSLNAQGSFLTQQFDMLNNLR